MTEIVAPVLRLPDMLALYGPNEYEILLASTAPEIAEQMVRELDAALATAGAIVRTGLATYPRDGRTPEALVAAASRRVRGEQGERAANGTTGNEIPHDAVMDRVYKLAERAAAGTINVLIVGETGVGKEVLAEAVHRMSPRAEKAFLCLNCASLSEHLLESELFGHERGAFTGASEAKPGLLETAPGGTVFLDEIGEMPLLLQAKLLRVLETRLVTRVGGLKPKAIDVRFVAATNRNLEEEVAAGRFRRDLYFRLNGMTLHIPPLRARRGEIAPLAALFLRQFSEPLGQRRARPLRRGAAHARAYVWPGNVRELRNMMERAVLLCTGDEILPEHLLIESMSAAMAPNIGPAPELAAAYPPARAETGSGLGSAPPVGFGIGRERGRAARRGRARAHPARARRVRRQPEPRRQGPRHRAQHARAPAERVSGPAASQVGGGKRSRSSARKLTERPDAPVNSADVGHLDRRERSRLRRKVGLCVWPDGCCTGQHDQRRSPSSRRPRVTRRRAPAPPRDADEAMSRYARGDESAFAAIHALRRAPARGATCAGACASRRSSRTSSSRRSCTCTGRGARSARAARCLPWAFAIARRQLVDAYRAPSSDRRSTVTTSDVAGDAARLVPVRRGAARREGGRPARRASPRGALRAPARRARARQGRRPLARASGRRPRHDGDGRQAAHAPRLHGAAPRARGAVA